MKANAKSQESAAKMEDKSKLEETGVKMEESGQDFGSISLFELSCREGDE